MHGGGAKQVRFKKNQTRVKFKICFKFGLKIKKSNTKRRVVWEGDALHIKCLGEVKTGRVHGMGLLPIPKQV
jgi:hypothetical protein